MNKNDILKHIATEPKYINYCKQVAQQKESYIDLFQFIILELDKKPEDYLIEKFKTGELDRIYLGMVYKNYNSTTSPFFVQYGKYYKYHFTTQDNCDFVDGADGFVEVFYDERGYTSYFVNEEPEIDLSKMGNNVKIEIEKFRKESPQNEYVVNLFNTYLEFGTYREIEKQTGIYFVTAQKTIQKFKKEIKKRCQKYLQ